MNLQIDPHTAVPQSIYKLLIGCMVPPPIAWVSSLSEDGIPNLAPFSHAARWLEKARAAYRTA